MRSARVEANFWPLLGVEPLLGRVFTPEEEKRGERLAVLSYQLWQQQFGGTKEALGSLGWLPETGLFAAPGKTDIKPVNVVLKREGSGLRPVKPYIRLAASAMEVDTGVVDPAPASPALPLSPVECVRALPALSPVLL